VSHSLKREYSDSIRIHVFADLQPYICTFEGCRSMLVTFPSRKMWSEHELMQHRTRRSWKCRLCSNTFTAENLLTKHLQLTHDLSEHHCNLLVASSPTESLGPVSAKDEQCPLCLQKGWTNQRKFITHKGRHLEDIALLVLPREFETDSDQQSDVDEIVASTNAFQPPFSRDLLPKGPGEDDLLIQHPSHRGAQSIALIDTSAQQSSQKLEASGISRNEQAMFQSARRFAELYDLK
jgi:hypothetical protein